MQKIYKNQKWGKYFFTALYIGKAADVILAVVVLIEGLKSL